jgi:hypothetical protein
VDLSSIYSEIKQILSISDDRFDLEGNINTLFKSEPEENKLEILGDILSFVNKFSLFKEIKPFMNSLYECINGALEIESENVFDFEDILIKNSILHFVQEYINYSQLSQKDQVLQYLSDSLEKLQPQALITNLGLLLKPMYGDLGYLNNLKKAKSVEVTYNQQNGTENLIKIEIDSWLNSQTISLDGQDKLKHQLNAELKRLSLKYNVIKDSEKSKKLHLEASEMLSMKLTMLSLMEHIPDDTFGPIPIK